MNDQIYKIVCSVPCAQIAPFSENDPIKVAYHSKTHSFFNWRT